MAFEGLSDKLAAAFKKLRIKRKADRELMSRRPCGKFASLCWRRTSTIRSRRSLSPCVTEKAIGAEVLESLTPAQQVIKIVNEELTALMGAEQAPDQYLFQNRLRSS